MPKTVQWSVTIIIIVVTLLLLSFLSMMILITGFTCPPSIHFKLTNCDKCYYIVRQLLQSATGIQSATTIRCDTTDPNVLRVVKPHTQTFSKLIQNIASD